MEINLDYLFNDVPLYTKEEFKVFELKEDKYELNEEELERFNTYIGIDKEKLVTICHKCKKEFPFNVEKRFLNGSNNSLSVLLLTNNNSQVEGRFGCKTGTVYGGMPPYAKDELLDNEIWYVEYCMKCTKDANHKYFMMISIELKSGKFIVRKIGQNPSMLTVKGFDFDKYKDILEILNAYNDYKKADLCNADHFHVGGYAYLRRIFEKMINFYIDGKVLKDNHMSTKIEEVKEKFDPRIRDLLKNMYGILSKGVHELEEEESKQYYSYLKTIIDMQLEFMSTEAEKEKQTEQLKKEIDKIANLVNNK